MVKVRFIKKMMPVSLAYLAFTGFSQGLLANAETIADKEPKPTANESTKYTDYSVALQLDFIGYGFYNARRNRVLPFSRGIIDFKIGAGINVRKYFPTTGSLDFSVLYSYTAFDSFFFLLPNMGVQSIQLYTGLNYIFSFGAILNYDLAGTIYPQVSLGDTPESVALPPKDLRRPGWGVYIGGTGVLIPKGSATQILIEGYQTALDFLYVGLKVSGHLALFGK